MDANAALELLLDTRRLRRTPRSGWVMCGVADAESMADHSIGVAHASLILSEPVEQPQDKARSLTTALLHDLPESLVEVSPRLRRHASLWEPNGKPRQR